MRLSLCEAQPVRQGQTTTPGTTCPTRFDKFVGSLTSPADHVTLKMQETGPTVYSPYHRKQFAQFPLSVVSSSRRK